MAINMATVSYDERELFMCFAPPDLQDPCTLMKRVSEERHEMMHDSVIDTTFLETLVKDTGTGELYIVEAEPFGKNQHSTLLDHQARSRNTLSKWKGLHEDDINCCLWETYFGESIVNVV